jgi:hypothetical protein
MRCRVGGILVACLLFSAALFARYRSPITGVSNLSNALKGFETFETSGIALQVGQFPARLERCTRG